MESKPEVLLAAPSREAISLDKPAAAQPGPVQAEERTALSGTPPPHIEPRPPRKSLLELLAVPTTLTIITALAGSFALWINTRIQEAETQRTFRATQIDAVAKLPFGATATDAQLYAPRLAAYGEFGIPLLTAILQSYPVDDEDCKPGVPLTPGSAAEASLIQIGVLSGKSEAVGNAMSVILHDRWRFYDRRVHESALRVLSAVCYSKATSILNSYDPEHVIQDWDHVLANQSWKNCFDRTFETSREIAASCDHRKHGETAP